MVQATLLGIEKHVLSLDIRFSHLVSAAEELFRNALQHTATHYNTSGQKGSSTCHLMAEKTCRSYLARNFRK